MPLVTQNGRFQMFDAVATLIAYGEPTYDEYGNETRETVETEIYVQPRGVYQSEFYNAAQNGLQPSLTLYMTNREDYAGQKHVVFEGVDYTVIRVDWSAQRDGISLICEERIGNGQNE